MAGKDMTVSLTQFSEPVVIPWNGNHSDPFNARGARGLLIFVPTGWATATLDFYGIKSTQPVLIRDNDGNKLMIENIVANGFYIAPAGAWAVGALESVQLFSRNTGDTDYVSQTIPDVTIYPLR